MPRIKLNGLNIGYVKELKYLGIIFDYNFSWIPHINYLAGKSNTLIYKVANFAKPTWGWSPTILKNIYICVIEKTILYACSIWFNTKVKFMNKLISVNRSVY